MAAASVKEFNQSTAGSWVFPEPKFEKVGNTIKISFKNIEFKQKQPDNTTTRVVLNMDVLLDNPRFIPDFEYKNGEVLKAVMELGIDRVETKIDIVAGATVTHTSLKKEFDLIKPKFRPLVVAGVPLPVGALATFKGVIELSGSIDVSMSMDSQGEYYFKVYKEDDDFKSIKFMEDDFNFEIKEIKGKPAISAYVKPGLSLAYLYLVLDKKNPLQYENLLGIEAPVGVKGEVKVEEVCNDLNAYFFADGQLYGKLKKRTDFNLFHWKSDPITFFSSCDTEIIDEDEAKDKSRLRPSWLMKRAGNIQCIFLESMMKSG